MAVAITMVPLGDGARLSQSKLAADWMTWNDVVAEPEISKEKRVMSFGHGDYFIAIALMAAPIPPQEIEGPIATSILWPEAATEMKKQKGHLIVTVMSQNEEVDPIELWTVITQVTTSVLASTEGALGVYVGDAGMMVGRDLYIEMAREIIPHGMPLYLWIDFRVGPVDQDSGLSFGFTQGMARFGHMEFATENASEPPGELHDRLLNLADYLLTNGPVIEDGHTVGADANEKITVSVGPSPFGHEEDVMRLDYSSKKKKRGWFG